MRFVPEDLDASKWSNLEPYYNKLRDRDLNCSKCIEKLIKDESELSEFVSEKRAKTYINMTCHTDDEHAQNSWKEFVENIQPKLSEYNDLLNKRIVNHKSVSELPEKYDLMIEAIKSDIGIFREENIPLQTRLSILGTKYNEIRGKQTVHYDGEERTFPMMAIYQENVDRGVRESAWKTCTRRILEDTEEISEIFDEMIKLRHQISTNSGFDGYQEYMFAAMHRFDYTIADCMEFHDSIESSCMPLKNQFNEERKNILKLDKFRPWDSSVDLYGNKPLRPFNDVSELIEGCSKLFHSMSKELGDYFAFHSFYSGHLDLIHERDSPIEFAEVASMSMELLSHSKWEQFYNKDDAIRAKKKHLEGIIEFMPWMATIDSFQHWIYQNPNHTREERRNKWLEITNKFGSKYDYSGISEDGDNMESILETSWQLQGHLFGAPFYYVEYGIAQLGALQLWNYHKENPLKALDLYKNGLSLGYTKGLRELFTATGLEMSFKDDHVTNLINEVHKSILDIEN
ncbi:MAG: M3 family oligoendopeptidase [Candidatus Poseidoniales archaeon]